MSRRSSVSSDDGSTLGGSAPTAKSVLTKSIMSSPKYSEVTEVSQWFSPVVVDIDHTNRVGSFEPRSTNPDYAMAVVDYSILYFLARAIKTRRSTIINTDGVRYVPLNPEEIMPTKYTSMDFNSPDDWTNLDTLDSLFKVDSGSKKPKDSDAEDEDYTNCVASVRKNMMGQLLKMDGVYRSNALTQVTFEFLGKIYRVEGFYVELTSSDEYIEAAMAEIEADARKMVNNATNRHNKMQGLTLRVKKARTSLPVLIDRPWSRRNIRALILEVSIAKWSAASASERFRPPMIPDVNDKIARAVELIIEWRDVSAQCDDDYVDKGRTKYQSLLKKKE